MLTGKIKALFADKGYGFITPGPGKPDVFFHASDLPDKSKFATFEVNQPVTFETKSTEKGLRAINVALSEQP